MSGSADSNMFSDMFSYSRKFVDGNILWKVFSVINTPINMDQNVSQQHSVSSSPIYEAIEYPFISVNSPHVAWRSLCNDILLIFARHSFSLLGTLFVQ